MWRKAIEDTGTELAFYNYRERRPDEVFPWDVIDIGVSKEFLYREYMKAHEGLTTPNCREMCSNCGMRRIAKTGVCYERRRA